MDSDIYEIGQEGINTIVLPVMDDNPKTQTLAFGWARILADVSGKNVTIYRNGAWFIEMPPLAK